MTHRTFREKDFAPTARRRTLRPLWLRRMTFAFALLFAWSFVFAAPVAALAQQPAAHPKSEVLTDHAGRIWRTVDYRSRRPVSLASLRRPAVLPTLLDEVGNLTYNVAPGEAEGWKRQIRSGSLPIARAARLHLWVGEWEMSKEQDPEQAIVHFRKAQHLLPAGHPDRGVAAYDAAIALYFEGDYRAAADAFRGLLTSRGLHGYDRHHAALWLRHAAACAGYPDERAKLGIPEPPRLDPLCGAAALAACLRERGLPADKQTLLAACRVTGRGSNLQDILDAGKKLGVSVRAVTADDTGLKAMPMPAVAYVEHDHFIAVIHADKQGVSYLCSDCGPWPGGRVNLTWQQWHALNPTAYAVVTKKDSQSDRWLKLVLAAAPGKQAQQARQSKPWRLVDLNRTVPPPAALVLHLVTLQVVGGANECGFANSSLQCPCHVKCPWDCPGWGLVGALGGDPVNLATGEESFQAPSDLVVYNPTGPAVVWKRAYESLRGFDAAY